MNAGIPWSWETYPEYLDAVDRLPKGINYAGYVGHSALRTYVMGERAMEEKSGPADIARMKTELEASLRAGALGMSPTKTDARRVGQGGGGPGRPRGGGE